MKLTKVRAGYYEYSNFFIYKPEANEPWWIVYEWIDRATTESAYVIHAASLRDAKEFLSKIIAIRTAA